MLYVLFIGVFNKDAVPPVLAQISGPMPFMTYFNQLSDQELIDLHNDLEKTGGRGANEAQYFLRENIKAYRPQIDVNELKTGFGDFVQSLYQRYVPRAENLAQTGEAIFTTPVDAQYVENVKKKLLLQRALQNLKQEQCKLQR